MNFDELHALVPYIVDGKEKSVPMSPYPNIELAQPGRHAQDTTPPGGDFVVRVTDKHLKWRKHEFSHTDIFASIERFRDHDLDFVIEGYLKIVQGEDPSPLGYDHGRTDVITPANFFHAVQCLAVAEHRRYAQHEAKWGGRYLPFRFAAGIAEGLWDSVTASAVQRYGRPAVERLEKQHGTPELTEILFSMRPGDTLETWQTRIGFDESEHG